jgi:hypothetical protein
MNHERVRAVIEWATEAAAEHVQLAVFQDEKPSPNYGQGLWQSFEHNFPNRGEDCDILSTILSATYGAVVKALVEALPSPTEIFELYKIDVASCSGQYTTASFRNLGTLGWYATYQEAVAAGNGIEDTGIDKLPGLRLLDDSIHVVRKGKPQVVKRFGLVETVGT